MSSRLAKSANNRSNNWYFLDDVPVSQLSRLLKNRKPACFSIALRGGIIPQSGSGMQRASSLDPIDHPEDFSMKRMVG
jgi:hypothetical protein